MKPADENCKSIAVTAPDCEDLHKCFVNTLKLIDECCITYDPVPAPLGLGGDCNSNCTVGWVLKTCIAPKGFLGFIPLPVGQIAPGVHVPVPRCVRNPPGAAKLENEQSSTRCRCDGVLPG